MRKSRMHTSGRKDPKREAASRELDKPRTLKPRPVRNSQTHATISGSSSTTKMFRVDPLFGCDIPPDSIVRAEAEKTESTPVKEIKDHTGRSRSEERRVGKEC